MGKALFITGTGTDVGKTALSLALIFWAESRGLRVAYSKPIQCGTAPMGGSSGLGELGGDADWIRLLHVGQAPVHVTYRLRLAASPHLAAEREGIRLDPERIKNELASLAANQDLLLVEGAGGAAVPLNREGLSLAALAAELRLPCLIACAPGLGTLHHTLATVAYLKSLSAPIAGFAFCHRDSAAAEELSRDNLETLSSLTGLPCFGSLAYSEKTARGIAMGKAEAEAWWTPLAGAMDAWWSRDSMPGTGTT